MKHTILYLTLLFDENRANIHTHSKTTTNMKSKAILLLLSITLSFSLNAQKLSFNNDGEFKIVQFTDMHYDQGNPKSDTTLQLIPYILDAENPDLVIFTGDIVTGSINGWEDITKFVIDREIPFAVTLGNHDHENGSTREEIAEVVTSYPFNINTINNIGGRVLNDAIPVYNSEKHLNVGALIYCFDSGAYSTIEGVGGYGWITTDQIEWYKKQSMHYTLQNNLNPLPALAFFHIPLPEYRTAFNDENNIRFGERNEDECPSEVNSGMFLAMREMRDVMATFVGHDHVNDYIVNYYGIALAYGHFSGWNNTYTPKPVINGARVVVLKENKREFDSWLHQLNGTIKHKITYPTDFEQTH